MFKKLVDLELSRNQQTIINITAAVVNMLVTTLISFVLSPYIVKTLGVEANGFVGLANNFITYAALISTALNSMGSRFMMMAYYNDEHEKFRRYYSSLLLANLLLAVVFGMLGGLCVWKLEILLDIPAEIVGDVKLLFAMIFANFFLSTAMTVWGTAPFLKNRLYLNSVNNTASAVVRGLMILGLFLCLEPTVSFVGFATLISGCVVYGIQFFYKQSLFPELRARRQDFSWSAIRELIASGIWNTISNVGHILASGIDLLVTNLFINATTMGTLSLAHTMPAFINTLNETISGSFTPALIIDYAQKRIDNIVKTIRQSSKIISVICSLPLGFLLVFGREFYALWQPTQDPWELYTLSLILIFGRVLFTGMQPLFSVFTVVNKVREHSIIMIANGFASVGLMYILLNCTDLGVYAIVGSSVICACIKNLLLVIPLSARYLGLKPTAFYSTVVYSLSCCTILTIWGALLRMFLKPDGWGSLFATGILFAGVGLLLTSMIVLNKSERTAFISMLRKKLTR